MSCRVGPVILGYGAGAPADIARLVDELSREGVDRACITVVHNPSAAAAELKDSPPGVRIINAERNLGYAGGMNLGIRPQLLEQVPYVLLLTQDVHLEPGVIERLLDAADLAPRYGVLGPRLRWEGRSTILNFGGRWSATGAGRLVDARPADDDGDGIVPCDYVDGAIVLFRSELLAKVGLMSERFFMYFEESELCLRAKRAGWEVGVVLEAEAAQSSGETKRPGAFSYLMARNGLEFARLVGGRPAVLASIGRDVAQSFRLVKMRFSPKSDQGRRGIASASLIALWMGVLAYFRGRWGPPPADVPGLGDVG